ncbi:Prp 4 c domain-containing [Curvularia clavata]|uniref:Prp 4 c domain-containing n=1 Tax=Curvularia clavata TaxID=95742 RepID=A0A9Q8ZAA3_CURCL|nr:Prp 4 c domain-containing [Curvularia clavata]
MHAPLVTLALLSTSVLALQGTLSTPRSYGAMLPRGNAMSKRQGYYPISTLCNGDGNTCAEVCGADTAECPSNDNSMLSCHLTTDGSHCCTDGTGNSCGAGDYCTNDGAGQTYCCPENLNAAECAKAFGVDVTLIPDSPASATGSAPSPSAVVPSAKPTPVESATQVASSSPAVPSPSSKSVASSKSVPSETPVVPVVPSASKSSAATPSKSPNATTASSPLPTFTGGAAKVAGAGAAVVVAVAGLVML